jgi:nicotinamidase-related amidase
MTDPSSLFQSRQARIDAMHQSVAGRTAMLVVDMQYGFLHPNASLYVPAGRNIIGSVALVIEACRKHDVPVIFTEFVYSEAVPCLRGDPFGVEHLPAAPGQPTGYGHPSSNCLIGPNPGRGAESAETISELAPREDELVIRAHGYDKFYGTPLDLALQSRGIDRLLVTGVTTDVCVNSTVLAAANRNYRVTVITDGVATLDDSIQDACFRIWQRKFARLRSTEQILDSPLG